MYLQPDCPIFRLPRELRDLIYEELIATQDGYSYDAYENRLIDARGGAVVDLRFMRVCRRIMEETEGLPMRKNKIAFRSLCTSDSSYRAGVLHATLHRIERSNWYKLCMIGPHLITDEIQNEMAMLFPQFRPVVGGLRSLDTNTIHHQFLFRIGFPHSYGETPSYFRQFLQALIDRLSKGPEWSSRSIDCTRMTNMEIDFEGLVPNPWAVLDEKDVERIKTTLYPEEDWQHMSFTLPSDGYTISAAALAIQFLSSLPSAARKTIRRIELLEGQAAVAYAESHVQGLVSFCQENPHLRIRRVADLWKCVLPAVDFHSSINGMSCIQQGLATEQVAKWMLEARRLRTLGMPSGCFTLVLDGAQHPSESSFMFDRILEDIVEQVAMDRHHAERLQTDESWLERRAGVGRKHLLYFEHLPSMMQDVVRSRDETVVLNFGFEPHLDWDNAVDQFSEYTWEAFQSRRVDRWQHMNFRVPPIEFLRRDWSLGQWEHRISVD
jgi:hypothetical protein